MRLGGRAGSPIFYTEKPEVLANPNLHLGEYCTPAEACSRYPNGPVDASKLETSMTARQSNKRVDTKGMYLIWSIHSGPKRSGVMT